MRSLTQNDEKSHTEHVPEQPAVIGFCCQYIAASFSLVLFVFSPSISMDKNVLLFGQKHYFAILTTKEYCKYIFAR